MVLATSFYRGPLLAGLAVEPEARFPFDQFVAFEPGQSTYWSSQGTIASDCPFEGGSRITSGVGSSESFRFTTWQLGPHGGLDFVPLVPGKIRIHTLRGGTVVGNEWSDGAGNVTTLQVGPRVWQEYAHQKALPDVAVGAELEAGAELGEMGDTGEFATGAHLHVTTFTTTTIHHSWRDPVARRYVDPLPYLGRVFSAIPASGVHLATIVGGGLIANVLDYAGRIAGVNSISVTRAGEFVTYVPAAPSFVNAAFLAEFPNGWMPEGESVLLAA